MAFPNEDKTLLGKDGLDMTVTESSLKSLYGTTFLVKLHDDTKDQAWWNSVWASYTVYKIDFTNNIRRCLTLYEISALISDHLMFPSTDETLTGKDGLDMVVDETTLRTLFGTTFLVKLSSDTQTDAWWDNVMTHNRVFGISLGGAVQVKPAVAYLNIGGVIKEAIAYANIGGTIKQLSAYFGLGGTTALLRCLTTYEISAMVVNHLRFPNFDATSTGKDGLDQ